MPNIRNPRRYGWRPQLPDHRDRFFLAPPNPVPPLVSLRHFVTTVFDQGQEGSCTANSIIQHMMMCRWIEKKPPAVLSRNFLYFNERLIEGDTQTDGGAEIRDGIKSAASTGVCLETLWPYNEDDMFRQPPGTCYVEAKANIIETYAAVSQNLQAMKACLASGYPFVFGFSVYDSFESDTTATTGNAPLPGPNESLLGGHAVCCVGYNDGPTLPLPNSKQVWPTQTFLVQNSWGTGWGLQGMNAGCFTLNYSYLTNPNLASDFWTVRLVS